MPMSIRPFPLGVASAVVVGTLLSASLLSGSIPNVSTGTWQSSDSMATSRADATATLLPDGRVLVVGGSDGNGPVASADIYSMGSFSSVASMASERKNHAAVLLESGAVLVTGGITSAGTATNAAEIYHSGSASWSSAGTMSDPRSGHTATLLGDGRVLIAGGDSSAGVLSSIEIYDPSSDSFSHAGTMSAPRTNHAAALLPDGRVLLVGGSDGTQALASSDIFNPKTDSVLAGPGMAAARSGASATNLLDGKILVAGGNDGSGDLASAEIYSSGGFSPAGDSMSTPRSGHLAFRLNDNNAVLIVGGSSGGSPVGSAELYYPWSKNFVGTGSMSVGRANASGSALHTDGRLFVAGGGGQAGSEVYGFATLFTDKADYAPGEYANVSGSGWQPGETVTLTFHEDLATPFHPDEVVTTVADSSGDISGVQYLLEDHDVGLRYYLTAVGASSQARTTFTDANRQININAFSIVSQAGATDNGVNTNQTLTVRVQFTPAGSGSWTNLSAALTVPGGWTKSANLSSLTSAAGTQV